MSPLGDEARALFTGPNIAHIATLLPDGGPYSVPVMIDIEGEVREVFLVEPAHVTVPTFG